MKRTIFLFFLFFCTHSFAQKVAIKNNLAYDALKTPNLSLEFSMGRKWTLDTQCEVKKAGQIGRAHV